MANRVLVNENSLADIAAAIREKTGNTEASFTPGQMGDAIRAIEANAEPVIEALSITANGVYTAPEGLDGYNPITVEIEAEVIEPVVESITITENGTYTPSTGVHGFNEVEVNVPSSGGGGLPEEAFNITGDCANRFAFNGWNWFINEYGNKINTSNITNGDSMFFNSTSLTEIPFEINFNGNVNTNSLYGMFYGSGLTEPPKINYVKPTKLQNLFQQAGKLERVRNDFTENWDWSYLETLTNGYNGQQNNIFTQCYRLREYPNSLFEHGNPVVTYSYSIYYGTFNCCYTLEEVRDLPFPHYNAAWTSNAFTNTFRECARLKEFTFKLQDDGTPYSVNWKSQTIDMSYAVGYCDNKYKIPSLTNIGEDKKVIDDASYQALKDDADWWSMDVNYSRYNHTSAVNTINSLPITTGSGCSIKFKGAAGSLTDGGAISNLTEEEIAVAAAKGWTVSLV